MEKLENTYFLTYLVHVSMDEVVQHKDDITIPDPNRHNSCNCRMATLGRFSSLHAE